MNLPDAVLARLKTGDTVWIANRVPYILAPEGDHLPHRIEHIPIPSYAELFFEQLAILCLMLGVSVGAFSLFLWALGALWP